MSASTSTSLHEAVEAAKMGRTTTMRCPAHDDKAPSLSVGPGEKHPVAIHCHANVGCTIEDILEAGGMTWADVMADRETERETFGVEWTPAGDTTTDKVYDYCDADGVLTYQVVRIDLGLNERGKNKKQFFQRRPDPVKPGKYLWKMDGVERILYRLPRVMKAIAGGHTVHVAEGEKCVHALEKVIPDTDAATCNSGGAGKWLENHTATFSPGTRVIIYADADEAGRAHAREVREQLHEAGCLVRVMEVPAGTLPNGKMITDIADHIEAKRGFDVLLETAPEEVDDRVRTAVDVLTLVSQKLAPTRYVIEGTLAAQERLLIVGLEGRGKSTLMRQIAACTAGGLHPFFHTRMEPRRVLYIDAENATDQTLGPWKNLVGLMVRHSSPIEPGMLNILEEWDAEHDLTSAAGRAWAMERVHAYQPDLICLGPLTNLTHEDLGRYEVVDGLRRTINKLRTVSGAAIVMEHHPPLRAVGDKKREVRPYGSSLFYKWPDYGFAMVPTDDNAVYEWRAFRGKRRREHLFPETLRQGSAAATSIEFPWMEGAPL